MSSVWSPWETDVQVEYVLGGRESGTREVYSKRAMGDSQLLRVVCEQGVRLHLKDSSMRPSRWEQ